MSLRKFAFFLALALAVPAFGQAPPKRVITDKDYDNWNTASGVTLSPDGKWLAYNFFPAEGDGQFVVKNIVTGAEFRLPRGGRPAAPPPTEGPTATPPAPGTPPTILPGGGGRGGAGLGGGTGGGSPMFAPDSKTLFVTLPPSKAELDKAKDDKKETPRSALCVVDLAAGKIVERIARVRTSSIVGDKPAYLVLHMEARPEPKAEEKKDEKKDEKKTEEKPKEKLPMPGTGKKPDDQPPAGGGRGGRGGQGRGGQGGQPGGAAGGPTPPGGIPRRAVGSDLVFRNLTDSGSTTYSDVVEYVIAKDVKHLVYTTSTKAGEGNTLRFAALGKDKTGTAIKAPKARYYRMTWDDKQTKLAFFGEEVPAEKEKEKSATPTPPAAAKPPTVYVWDRGTDEAKTVLTPETPGLTKAVRLTDRTLRFSPDGKALSLTVIPAPVETEKPATPAPAIAAADKVDMDLWHWKDELIQPMQRLRANQERNRSYPAAYFFDTKRLRQLGTEDLTVGPIGQGEWTIGTDDKPYRYLTGYGASLRDNVFVNVRTGETKPVWKAYVGRLATSPSGKLAVTFDSKDWWVVTVPEGKKVNLTEKLPVKFFNEDHDTPDEARPYGQPQWTSDEKYLLISDRYDIWKIAADGSGAENLTKIGRELKTQFRLLRLSDTVTETPTGPPRDAEPLPGAEVAPGAETPTGFDLSKTWLLAAENLHTRDTGFYRLEPGQKPKLLVMAARKFGTPVQSKSGDTYLLTAQTFSDYADYYAADRDFKEIKRLTDIQPKVREFIWGKAELVHYSTTDGKPLSAILVKPENFDPNKKYPMIVYIYERLSQNFHNFTTLPMVTRGQVINPAVYASNGYLVLMPDIAYQTGYPGPSAMKCVMPAIQAVVDKGFVDENAIGINGQSWGGYQIAYMITQTNRFKAAVAGAAGDEHDERLRRHPLGHGPAPRVPVRTDAESDRRHALAGPDAVPRKLAGVHGRPRADARHDDQQRQGRRGAVVPGHRVLPCVAPPRQRGVHAQLHRRSPQPPQEGQRTGLLDPHEAVLRPPPEGGPDARVDGEGCAV